MELGDGTPDRYQNITLWHAGLTAPVSNGPMTYELDGRQYLVVGAIISVVLR